MVGILGKYLIGGLLASVKAVFQKSYLGITWLLFEVLFETCVAMKFVYDDDVMT